MIQSISNIKDKVKKILIKHESMRDNDHSLIAFIYYKLAIAKGHTMNDQSYTAMNFLGDFSNGKYPSPESIRRCRQKIQEQHPELRGSTYNERKSKADIVKNQIKDV